MALPPGRLCRAWFAAQFATSRAIESRYLDAQQKTEVIMKKVLACPRCRSEVRHDPWKLIASTQTTVCESCGAALKATFDERSTFIALATGGVVWFAAFVTTNAAGYPEVSEAAASVADVAGRGAAP